MFTLSLDKQIFKKMNKENYLAYTHYPHPSNESVIIIHGLLGCKDNWKTIAKTLSEQLNVYCIDCRNHGQSFHNDSMTYNEMSLDLIQLMDYLKLKNPFIIGHSMGGKIAMHSLQQNPNRFQKAMIIDIAPKAYEDHHQTILTAMQTVNLSKLLTRTVIDTSLSTLIPDPRIRQLLLKNIKRNQDNHFYWQCNTEAIANNYHHIMNNSISKKPIHIPTLFLRGENSFYINEPTDTNQIKTLFNNVTIKTIKGAGHWLQSEQPALFIKETLQFLLNIKNQS